MQLEDSLLKMVVLGLNRFNSILVQLEEEAERIALYTLEKFQFHIGAIRSGEPPG